MRKIFILVLLILLFIFLFDSKSKLSFINWINYSPDFKNKKFLAIEFWATWCVPCITLFPKIEEYQKKYPEIQFFGLSNENSKIIKKFLEKRNLTIPIGQDIDNYWHKKLKITYYPTLVLMDSTLNVIFKGHPYHFFSIIDSLLAEPRFIASQTIEKNEVNITTPNNNDTLICFVLKRSKDKKFTLSNERPDDHGLYITFLNYSIKDIIKDLLNVNKKFLKFDINDTTRYDFYVFIKNYEISKARKVALDFLLTYLNFKITISSFFSSGYELIVRNRKKLNEFEIDPKNYENIKHYSSNDTLCSIANYNLKELAELMSDLFTIDIEYFGKDDGRYNFEIPLNFQDARKILNEHYGIILKSIKKKSQLYIVKKK